MSCGSRNTELVQQLVDAVAHQDVARLIELTDPEVEWHSLFAQLREGGVYHGHDGIRQYVKDLADTAALLQSTIDDTLAVSAVVLAIGSDDFLPARWSKRAESVAGARSRDTRGGTTMQHKITPNLWFDTEAEEAAGFYTSVFENSRIVNVSHYTEAGPRPAGTVMVVEFELDGQRFVGINGGPQFKFDEAVSFQISCETQDEVDYYWEKLTDGGEESQCGWLKDRYGLSWQVTPAGMDELFSDSDPERAERAMKAMLQMRKLDIEALRSAADGVPTN